MQIVSKSLFFVPAGRRAAADAWRAACWCMGRLWMKAVCLLGRKKNISWTYVSILCCYKSSAEKPRTCTNYVNICTRIISTTATHTGHENQIMELVKTKKAQVTPSLRGHQLQVLNWCRRISHVSSLSLMTPWGSQSSLGLRGVDINKPNMKYMEINFFPELMKQLNLKFMHENKRVERMWTDKAVMTLEREGGGEEESGSLRRCSD